MTSLESVVPVLLSGGAGTRLWPLSREHAPKQLAKVTGERTMLADTVARVAGLASGGPMVVANHEHRFGVAEELRLLGVKPRAIVLEPVGRSTAPAVAVSALLSEAEDPLLLVLPTDHFVADASAFEAAVRAAIPAAASGRLVVFGVEPTSPNTGYGWVRRSERVVSPGASELDRFAEKPDRATAERWLADGGWAWNSGMFLFRASVMLRELQRHAPDVLAVCRAAVAGLTRDLDFLRLPASFANCRSESIDYAVMERTAIGAVVPLGTAWSDLGSWEALWESSARDPSGNAVTGDVLLHGATGCLVRSDHRLVVAVDVADLLLVETADAVLVAPRSASERVKEAVRRLRDEGRREVVEHARVARPWGVYERLASGARFQVKTIRVDPGEALSLQRHRRRAEHWVVVRGTALVRVGERERELHENESTYIPVGAIHRLSNPGTEPLELVEVQTGDWLGEDDVERLEDRYGRRTPGDVT